MKRNRIIKNKKEQAIIAKARIEILYGLALESLKKKDLILAKSSIVMMKKISKKNKISLKKYNWFFCKKCLMPYDINITKYSTNRHTKTLDILCDNCGYTRKKPLNKS
ncbi:MAG: hypothetical protein KAQ92_02935 [Candidatus Aenigmarchaeota archaeon]|nr:hypothetical protein [Candidatus Aenigmarchaeota archaeon]